MVVALHLTVMTFLKQTKSYKQEVLKYATQVLEWVESLHQKKTKKGFLN